MHAVVHSDMDPGSADRSGDIVSFFGNVMPSLPQGDYVDHIIGHWSDAVLERHHGYIQWLLPNGAASRFNANAPVPTAFEVALIRTDATLRKTYLRGLRRMLLFWGFRCSGQRIVRSSNWRARFENLAAHPHNYLRITRALLSLSLFGFDKARAMFIQGLCESMWELPGAASAMRDHWLPASEMVISACTRDARLLGVPHQVFLREDASGSRLYIRTGQTAWKELDADRVGHMRLVPIPNSRCSLQTAMQLHECTQGNASSCDPISLMRSARGAYVYLRSPMEEDAV
jgi:hypothetical protein